MLNLTLRTKKYLSKFNLNEKTNFLKDIISLRSKEKNTIESNPVYREDGFSVEKIIETDKNTGNTVKITYFDYFDNKKIKSIEDFENGLKIKVTLFSFFKSVTDIDKNTGKKIRTTNFDIKNNNKKMSVYDYDIITEKIIRITVYRTDGKNIAFIKEFSPITGKVSRLISYKKDSSAISSVSKFETLGSTTVKTTYYYSTPIYLSVPEMIDKKIMSDDLNKRVLNTFSSKKFSRLIDNLYQNNKDFTTINVS